MAFEKWDPQPEFERFPASATIVQSRLIRLPSPVALMLRLRNKSNANLYYDKKRKVIGIRALDRKEEGAAKIRQSDKSTSLHVPSFFRFYDIDVPGHQALPLLVRREGADGDDRHLPAVAARTARGDVGFA